MRDIYREGNIVIPFGESSSLCVSTEKKVFAIVRHTEPMIVGDHIFSKGCERCFSSSRFRDSSRGLICCSTTASFLKGTECEDNNIFRSLKLVCDNCYRINWQCEVWLATLSFPYFIRCKNTRLPSVYKSDNPCVSAWQPYCLEATTSKFFSFKKHLKNIFIVNFKIMDWFCIWNIYENVLYRTKKLLHSLDTLHIPMYRMRYKRNRIKIKCAWVASSSGRGIHWDSGWSSIDSYP